MAELPGIVDTLAPIGLGGHNLVGIPLTAAQISAPTKAILANTQAIYYLNAAPFSEYQSNGTALVPTGATLDLTSQFSILFSNAFAPAFSQAIQATKINLATGVTGSLSSDNVVLPSSQTITQRDADITKLLINQGAATGATNSVQPGIATTPGSKVVGSVWTAPDGTWSNASGGFMKRWYRENLSTGVQTDTGQTPALAATYTATAADVGFGLRPATAGVNSAGQISDYVFASAVTTAILTTLATNTVAPSISISGGGSTGASGVMLALNAGTWSGNTTGGFVYQLKNATGAVVFTSSRLVPSANSMAYVTSDANVGTLTLAVTAYNADILPSAIATGNTVTITGAAPAVTVIAAATWPTHVYPDLTVTLVPGRYALNGVETPMDGQAAGAPIFNHDFYQGSSLTAYRTGNTSLQFTARTSEGAVAGVSLSYDESPTINGVQYGPFRSASKTVEAVPVTFAASLSAAAQAGLSLVSGAAISTTLLATISGGTKPYTAVLSSGSFNPALPAALAVSQVDGATVQVNLGGNPGANIAQRAITLTVGDSAGATPIVLTFNVTISSASGATPLTAIPLPTNTQINYFSGQWNGSTPIVCSDAASTVAVSVVKDPLGTGSVNLHVIHKDFANQSLAGGARAELTPEQLVMDVGQEYWIAYGFNLDNSPGVASDSAFIGFQTHTRAGGNTTPDTSMWLWPNPFGAPAIMYFGGAYATGAPTPNGDGTYNAAANTNVDYYGSVSGGPTQPMPAYNTWTRVIIRKVPGYLTAHGPLVQIWMSLNGGAYNQIANDTNFNTYNLTGSGLPQSYPRIGTYYFQTDNPSQWPMPSTQLRMWMSKLYFQQGSNLYANCVAALVGLGS